jgi:hypothetical protein
MSRPAELIVTPKGIRGQQTSRRAAFEEETSMNFVASRTGWGKPVRWVFAIGLVLTIAMAFAGKASASATGADKSIDVGSFRNPGRALQPHFIWYWPRNAVDNAELRLEGQEMAQAGAGGFQVLPEGGAALPSAGQPADAFDYGTPGWAEHIRTAMEAAQENGMTADLNTSDSWPWISPVTSENLDYSTQQLGFGAQDLTGPSEFVGAPPSAVGFPPEAKLVAVTAARRDPAGQDSLGRSLLDPSSVRDLTSTLDAEGKVHWQVPPGEWVLFGFWQSSTHSAGFGCQQAPEQCVNKGLALNHLSRAANDAATDWLDNHLFSRLGNLPERAGRLMHEDSLEGFGARLLWTGEFLREFRTRRGYDLTRYLPALAVRPGGGPGGGGLGRVAYDFGGGVGERIRHDYAQTLTELWVSNHIVPTDRWAHTHGMEFSGRAIGFDRTALDPIAADRAYDIPEIDHITDPAIDWVSNASSGAHLSGAPTTNSELGDLINRDQMLTFRDLKRLADRQFSGGANELELHLFPYQHAVGASWPSWSIFSAETIPFGISEGWSPNMPQWKDFPEMNGYFARAQAVLQAGRPVNDVAVYRDMQGSNDNGPPEDNLGDTLEPLINSSLTNAGFTFDIANPAAVTDPGSQVRNGQLVMEHPHYRALVIDLDGSARRGVVDSSHGISAAVARRLVTFAKAGLPIVFVGRYPDRGVSYADANAEDKAVNDAVASLKQMPNVRLASDPMDVAATLKELGVRADLALTGVSAEPVQCGLGAPCVYNVHRHTPSGDFWYLWNSGNSTVHFTGSFLAGSRAPSFWDLWNGDRSPIGLYDARAGRVSVPIELAPGEDTVIAFKDPIKRHVVATDAEAVATRGSQLYLRSTKAGGSTATLSDGGQREVQFKNLPAPVEPSQWHLHVDGAVPSGTETHDLELTQLEDWRDIPELESTSGTGTYTTNLTLGSGWSGPGRGAFLELGRIEGGSVSVFVNGHRVSDAVVPPPRLDVGRLLRPGSNRIEVVLKTTLKNRLYSLSSQPGYHRFAERDELTMPYGLLGPVRLVDYEDRRIR